MTQTLIHQRGGAVKAIPDKEGWIEGYLASWGNPQDADLQGEYFTPRTEFCLDWFAERPVLYHHGMDNGPALKAIGSIKAARTDDLGLWVQAQLDLRDKYARAVYDMVKAKEFGWSSGSVDHLVKIADSGEIVTWPLIEGSVTPTPAQPSKTTVRAFKALFDSEEFLRGLEARVGTSSEDTRSTKMASKRALQYAKAFANSLGLKLNGDELEAVAGEMDEDPSVMQDDLEDPMTMADGEEDFAGMAFGDEDDLATMAADEEDFAGMAADEEDYATMAFGDEDEYAGMADEFEETPIASSYRSKRKSRKTARPRQKTLDFEPQPLTDPRIGRMAQVMRAQQKRIKALEEMEAPGQRAFKSLQIKDEADVKGAYKSVFTDYMRRGEGPMSESQRYILNSRTMRMEGENVEAVKTSNGTWAVKTIVGGSDASFGFGIPEDWVNELNKNIAATTVMAPECRTRTTSSDALVQPNLVTTDARRAHVARTRWVGETPAATDHTATEDTLSQIRIPVHVCMISNPVSMNALEDVAFDIEAELTEAFSEAVGVDYDQFIYAGDGNGKLEGVTTNSLVSGSASAGVQTVGGYLPTGSASGFINADVVISMLYHLPAQYRSNAKWAMNSNTLREISLLKDGNGNYLMGDRNEGLRGATIPETLMNKPILVDEYAPDIAANTFPLIIGDFRRGYVIAKRVDFSVKRFDDSNYAELNQVLFLGRARLGGQVTLPSCFKVLKVAVS